MRATLAAVLTLFALTIAPARATDVQVRVATVNSRQGVVRAQVCRAFEWLKAGCAMTGEAPAVPGTTVVTVRDVPPGIYAIVAFHDRNNNGTVDQNLLGIPTEGVGFSNNPPLGIHGPHFADSAVEIGPKGGVVGIVLHFE